MTDALDNCRLCTRLVEDLKGWGDTRICRSCNTLFWFAEVLMESEATEAEIVSTLAFAPHADSLWEIADLKQRTAEAHRLLASYPAVDLVEVVDGVPVL